MCYLISLALLRTRYYIWRFSALLKSPGSKTTVLSHLKTDSDVKGGGANKDAAKGTIRDPKAMREADQRIESVDVA